MYKALLVFGCLFLYIMVKAQSQRSEDIAAIYEAVEKRLMTKNYEVALQNLQSSGGHLVDKSDSLLYLKIRVLENLYSQSPAYAKDMDSSLRLFSTRVNRYKFPEAKYAEVVSIHTSFQAFRERDQQFYDSVRLVQGLDSEVQLAAMTTRIAEYTKQTPHSFYKAELNERYTALEKKRKKIVDYTTNHEILKKVGKGNVFTIGYSIPGNKERFKGLGTYDDVIRFFDGKYNAALGIKYSLNASFTGALFNIYTGAKVKAGIAWNIFDAEYTVFDWSADSVLREGSAEGTKVGELKSIKAGTRIGPMVTVLLTRKIAVAAYYQARPGVQFILKDKYFLSGSGAASEEYTVKPKMINYDLSHELGIRLYFFKRVMINPFVHFGKFNWVNEISADGEKATETKASYSYNLAGIRIGI